ncbi:AbrB/MazE/SpoVT family DNA-binding domain-containing protein [Sphingomonas tabacisoli]|uniref:AbrB/MazE/SpoVT family DNA-binding domain-containing protein n=1 Tax=Sphingomonas tabacisoli TaxID=2249466 RepID=A0ABW4I101_9SPHN
MGKLLKIVKIGDEAGVVLPPEVLDHLHAELGDTLRLEEAGSGYALVGQEGEADEVMALARQIMREDADILRVLAQ